MKKPSEPSPDQDNLREKLIGLGEHSVRKSYYPELQRQLDNLHERVELAELAAEVGKGLTEELNLRDALQRCSDALEQHTDAAFVRIWAINPSGEALELQASSGLHTRIDGAHSRILIEASPYKIATIARDRKPLLTNEVIGNPQFHNQEWINRQGIVAFAGYPLILQQRLYGVIALFAQRPLNETVLDTLATITSQIAVGIERVRILEAYKAALVNARESHEKIDGILRSVADALLVIDNEQRILHMNQAAEALLGVTLDTVFNKPVEQITRESALLEYLARIDQFTSPNDDIDLEIIDVSRNEQRVIQARAARLQGTRSDAGLVISLRDVTQDREVARLKTEFISTAAHELRTPLTTIMGFAELLHNENCSAETQQEYLTYIIDKADSLEQIIDDLLDLSRIESGRGLSLNYSDWNLGNTLEKIIDRYRTEHQDYYFTSSVAKDLGMVHADHGKLLQVLDNLLSNAIKYSSQGTEIRLGADRTDGTVTLTVSDQGIGMTEQQLANCFEKFYRADASSTAVGGLGLGLSIVRHVIESHGGRITIRSKPGEGTTVTFTLPMHPEHN